MAQLEQDEERLTPSETGDDLSNDPAIQQMANELDAMPVQAPPEDEPIENEPEAPAPVQNNSQQHQIAPKHSSAESEQPKAMTIMDTGKTSLLNPAVYAQMRALANDFVKSGAMPKCWDSPAAILVGLQAGIEMGMKPMEAMNSLYFINGHINIWGKATVRRLKEHGWAIKYINESENTVTAIVSKGREKYEETYTFKEAELSGYTTHYDKFKKQAVLKPGWQPGINRKLKLRYGVLSIIIKTHIPEVIGAAEGIAEVDGDGYDAANVVEVESTVQSSTEMKVAKAIANKKKKDKLEPAPVEA